MIEQLTFDQKVNISSTDLVNPISAVDVPRIEIGKCDNIPGESCTIPDE